jgi:glycosyltransferase involved in cell wall biosynthesis
MTSQADLVVADSVYLKTVCEKINRNVVWIPDAVDTDFFLPAENKKNRPGGKLVLVWSGMAKKARPLEYIEQVLCELKNNVVLKIITGPKDTRNPWADVITRLVEKGVAETVLYKHDEYAGVLQEADAIISPRTLENTYEMAHTEYKITLGMSAGLPALASEQPAYVEALKDGGGFLCRSQEEWKEKIRWLIENPRERVAMGLKARDVVLRRFSIPVVAAQYQKALRGLFN